MAKAYVGTACLEQTGCDLPGVVEDGMSRRTGSESAEPLEARLGAVCTGKASGISRKAVKSGCACEWGGWGRLSDDGPGQKNPDRSEGPWGRAGQPARTEVLTGASSLTQSRESRWQQRARRTMANQSAGKAASDSPALKPYRGKPAVRNFRGGNGNVGIIRSPVRAIALPDSVDGPGQNNPDRSEGPWGRAVESARTEVFISASSLTQSRESRCKQRARRAMANQLAGKAASEIPALKPYRGKPA